MTVTEMRNPNSLSAFNEKFEFSFPRSDLQNDFDSKVINSLLMSDTTSKQETL